ncbi:hypothetical protein ACTORR_06440 [Pseudomonas sp. SAR267]|uniref:hypothetical protein n=1 Tax=unclassified Pseudomonas TaxID=196821 RepID=UPI0028AF9D7E|nr:hypothetical protein [Pseudomonas sp.]
MTSNSKAELLFWLSADNRLLGFDSVFAIDKTKTDTLLTQEYIRRFSTASYLPPVSGETAPDNNYKIHMQGFVLDHPRLSFDNADITDSRASLRMKIVGGNQVDLKQAGEHWYPRRMDRIGPLTGPELRLRLELGAVPGYVDEGGHVILDLSNSDDFVLTFAQSNRIRQLGGEFFKEIFMALPDEQRVWSLGRIEPGDDDLLRPESFFLRTQRNPSASFSPMAEGDQNDVDGAVIGLVQMIGSNGDVSLPGPAYRYLIPDGPEDHSATVLFERKRVAAAALIRALTELDMTDELFQVSQQGEEWRVKAIAGHLLMGFGSSYFEREINERGGFHVFGSMNIDFFDVPLAGVDQGLYISATAEGIQLNYDGVFDIGFFVTIVEQTSDLEVDTLAYRGSYQAKCRCQIRAGWRYAYSRGFVLEGDDIDIDYWLNDFHGPLDAEQPANPIHHHIHSTLASAASDMVRGALVDRLKRRLTRQMSTNVQLEHVVTETIKLNFGGAIVEDDVHLPRDIASFGKVSPRLTSFTVTPLETVITQGSRLQFTTQPLQQDVAWTCEAVDGSDDDPGNFDRTTPGLYLAPGAGGIAGEFTRVRVTATASNGYSSSALISVVKNALSLSPLVQVCQVGDEGVDLKAGFVGGGELRWRILGAQAHGRLALETGESNRYIPGENIAGRSFLVEEVEVSSPTDERRTLCIVTEMTLARPADVVIARQDAALRRVWLTITAGSKQQIPELTVVHGPGSIGRDADGEPYYQASDSSAAHFSVVRAFWELADFGLEFEGFIVLPLPLDQNADTYQTLQDAAQRWLRKR